MGGLEKRDLRIRDCMGRFSEKPFQYAEALFTIGNAFNQNNYKSDMQAREKRPISISRSNLPGRRRAESSRSGAFVAPMTTTRLKI
jgi:hypothetical protein